MITRRHKKALTAGLIITLLILIPTVLILDNRKKEAVRGQVELYQRGVELYTGGEFDSAIRNLKEAVELSPKDDRSHRLLGKAYEAKGELEKAAESYQASLSINADQSDTLYNLAIILKSQGKTAEAIEKLEEAVAVNKEFVAARLVLGDLYAQKGDKAKAREEYQAVIDMNPFGVDLESVESKLKELNR